MTQGGEALPVKLLYFFLGYFLEQSTWRAGLDTASLVWYHARTRVFVLPNYLFNTSN
jgi:hypothetical protein